MRILLWIQIQLWYSNLGWFRILLYHYERETLNAIACKTWNIFSERGVSNQRHYNNTLDMKTQEDRTHVMFLLAVSVAHRWSRDLKLFLRTIKGWNVALFKRYQTRWGQKNSFVFKFEVLFRVWLDLFPTFPMLKGDKLSAKNFNLFSYSPCNFAKAGNRSVKPFKTTGAIL